MKKIEFDKKTKKDSVSRTTTVATKLSNTELNLFKAKALEMNYSTSELLREIILKYLDNDVCHENILQSSMLKVMQKVDALLITLYDINYLQDLCTKYNIEYSRVTAAFNPEI